MRFFFIISLAIMLLAGAAAGCRKRRQQAGNVQTRAQSLTSGNTQIIKETDSNAILQIISSIIDQNQQNKPDINNQSSSVKSLTRVEPDKPQDTNKSTALNKPTEPNSNITKLQNEPNEKTNQQQSLQTPLAKFQNEYAEVLSENANINGRANYRKLKTKRADLYNLLEQLKQFDPNEYKSISNEEKIAFWINAYNIKMLFIIIDNYPIESEPLMRLIWPPNSVRHIDRKIGGLEKQKLIVMNEEFTLEAIEQNIFYKQLNEPMAYFALSHASLSDPPLRNEPYTGKKLNEQLGEQVKKYLSSSANFKIDAGSNKVYLPAILQGSWYGRFFIDKYGTDKKFKDQLPDIAAVLNCIIKYLPANDAAYIEVQNYNVNFIAHNWLINDQ